MKYTKEQINERFENLPEELKKAITSVETVDKLENVGRKYSLLLDQISELSDEVGLFMIGLTKQRDFIKNIANRLEIREDIAKKISEDINTEIFDSIKASLQKIQEQNEVTTEQPQSKPIQPPPPLKPTPPPPPKPSFPPTPPSFIKPITTPYNSLSFTPKPPPRPIPTPPPVNLPTSPNLSDLEKAGGFTIEDDRVPSSSSQYKEMDVNKDETLKKIEETPNTFVDHLLSTPVSNPQQKEEKMANTVDPYREKV